MAQQRSGSGSRGTPECRWPGMTSAGNRRRAGAVDLLGWGADAFGCYGARFCSNARMRRTGGVLQRREAVTALQRYEEDNTTRDDCADRCHAKGLFVWAEGMLLQAPSVTSYRGRKDPWHGHAFGFVCKISNAVAEPPGVYSTPPESERKTKPSDL